MNESDKAFVDAMWSDLDGWSRSDSARLLALVKELDDQLVRWHDEALRCTRLFERAEQQFAAVTAERDNLDIAWRQRVDALAEERDELKREVERLESLFQQTHGAHHGWVHEAEKQKQRAAGALSTLAEANRYQRELEAERDALRAEMRRLSGLILITRNDNPFHSSCMCRHCGDARELARLKGEKGGG